jgi:hypothetical protein
MSVPFQHTSLVKEGSYVWFQLVIILSCWSYFSLGRLNPEPLSYHVYFPITKAHNTESCCDSIRLLLPHQVPLHRHLFKRHDPKVSVASKSPDLHQVTQVRRLSGQSHTSTKVDT